MKTDLPLVITESITYPTGKTIVALREAVSKHLDTLYEQNKALAQSLSKTQEQVQHLQQEIGAVKEHLAALEKPRQPAEDPEPEPNPDQTLPYSGSGFNSFGGTGVVEGEQFEEYQVFLVATPEEFIQAIEASGPRQIYFKQGGVLDFRPYKFLTIANPYVSIKAAGVGGVTLLGLELRINANHVILDSVRIRVGDWLAEDQPLLNSSGWSAFSERDCVKINGHHVLFINCSFSWSTDELLQSTGSNIAFYRCLFLEPLASKKHHKGGHPKGSIHFCYDADGGKNLAFIECAYLNCFDRTPQLTAGITAYMRNCYIQSAKFGLAIVNDHPNPSKRGKGDTGGCTLSASNIVFENMGKNVVRIVGRPDESKGKLWFESFLVDGLKHSKPWQTLPDLQGEGSFGKHKWLFAKDQATIDPFANAPMVQVAKNYTPHNLPLDKVKDHVLMHAGPCDTEGKVNRDAFEHMALARLAQNPNAPHFDTVEGALTDNEERTLASFGLEPSEIFTNKVVDELGETAI